MDYTSYYMNGAGFYKGVPIQKGYGFSSFFKKFMRYIVPIVKEYALPPMKSAAKQIGTEMISSFSNIAKDVIDGNSLQESSKKRLNESIENLSKRANDSLEGKGLKKRRRKTIKHRDIFSF